MSAPTLDRGVHLVARPAGVEPASFGLEGRCLSAWLRARMAGDEGFEPSSPELEAGMLPLHQSPVARQVGFEPTTSGSEARRTGPLCYWRKRMGALFLSYSNAEAYEAGNFSPATSPCSGRHLRQRRRCLKLVCVVGIEPTTSCSQGRRATSALHAESFGRGSLNFTTRILA